MLNGDITSETSAGAVHSSGVKQQPLPGAWETLLARADVRGLELHQFSANSPIGSLYSASRSDGSGHVEGHYALHGVRAYVITLRTSGQERIDDIGLAVRLGRMLDFAQEVFRHFQTPLSYASLEAVVFYGSMVRGKPEPKDCDVRIVTSHYPHEPLDPTNIDRSPAENEWHQALTSTESAVRLVVDGRTINTREPMVESEYEGCYGTGLHEVRRGPFLAVVRLPNEGLGLFFNGVGTAYLKARPA